MTISLPFQIPIVLRPFYCRSMIKRRENLGYCFKLSLKYKCPNLKPSPRHCVSLRYRDSCNRHLVCNLKSKVNYDVQRCFYSNAFIKSKLSGYVNSQQLKSKEDFPTSITPLVLVAEAVLNSHQLIYRQP